MAVRATGIKINDRELKKFADRLTEKYVDRYISAGNKAQKEIREKSTLEWFIDSQGTMVDSLDYTHKLVQKNGKAIIYFTSYVDMNQFERLSTQNDSSIYRWKNKYKASIDPASFLLDLQWNQGIHGLPLAWSRPNPLFGDRNIGSGNSWTNPYFNQGESLESYTRNRFKKDWESTVNKYVKR